MRVSKDLVYTDVGDIKRNICEKICFYTECANITLDILLDRCGLERSLKTKIVNCNWKDMTFLQVFEICEALNIRYEDVYETKDEQIYMNILRDKNLCQVISNKIRERKLSRAKVASALDIKASVFRANLVRGLIANPTHVSNVVAYLNIKACDVKNLNQQKETPVIETQKQETEVNVMDEVVKACNFYKNRKEIVGDIEAIIYALESSKTSWRADMGKQQERVLKYMSDYGSISSLEAFRDLGVTRLSAVIFVLKRKGIKIKSVMESCKNRYGETVSFARYSVVGRNEV